MSAENDTLAGISTELLEQAPCHYCGGLVWVHPATLKPAHLSCEREAQQVEMMDAAVAERRAQRGEVREWESGESY